MRTAKGFRLPHRPREPHPSRHRRLQCRSIHSAIRIVVHEAASEAGAYNVAVRQPAWVSRMRLLWHGSDEEIKAILENDLLKGRRFVLGLRSIFMPTIQLAG